jgi:hypothetical protein
LSHFPWTKVNEMKPRASIFSRSNHFQSKFLPPPMLKMYRRFCRIRWISTKSSKRLQFCMVFYTSKLYATIINNIKQNISSNFVHLIHFDVGQVQFCSFHTFSTPVQNFDFGLLKFDNKFEIATFQYWSIGLWNSLIGWISQCFVGIREEFFYLPLVLFHRQKKIFCRVQYHRFLISQMETSILALYLLFIVAITKSDPYLYHIFK